jgi:hypothetical protein
VGCERALMAAAGEGSGKQRQQQQRRLLCVAATRRGRRVFAQWPLHQSSMGSFLLGALETHRIPVKAWHASSAAHAPLKARASQGLVEAPALSASCPKAIPSCLNGRYRRCHADAVDNRLVARPNPPGMLLVGCRPTSWRPIRPIQQLDNNDSVQLRRPEVLKGSRSGSFSDGGRRAPARAP